jgi:2-oxoglutarate/2-oxoacid ferredoxin oxidoreductase subunit alpha
MKQKPAPTDLALVLCGEQGQGIQTVEQTLTLVLKRAGYHVFSTKEYMSRIRGGASSTLVRVADRPKACPVDRIDVLVALSRGALPHLEKRLSRKSLVIGDQSVLGADARVLDVPFSRLASEAGGALFTSAVAVGTVLGLLQIPVEPLEKVLADRYQAKGPDVVDKNLQAAQKGHAAGSALAERLSNGRRGIKMELKKDGRVPGLQLHSGGSAVTFGAMAGGCNFLASYPMSPSTSVLAGLAAHARRFGLVVEQAEDEIAAINMALGASYAGARAMVTTSGGGFALMTEGISLAGMIETPVVIHLGQRPGPATGLPTRTEQGDLEMALHAGHGEFPRVLFAPGTLAQGFNLTARAFDLADRFQIPVIILTDQFFMDSYAGTEPFDLSVVDGGRCVVQSGAGYRRYELTADGVSPRGIPGWGEGLVCVDSDEHTEAGFITEDMDLRRRMVEKRLVKLRSLKREALPPERFGRRDAKTLVLCWGSNRAVVEEALQRIEDPSVAALHFSQVYPLWSGTAGLLKRARKVIAVENNATGQFCRLVLRETGFHVSDGILKYDGLPFSVEEVEAGIRKRLPVKLKSRGGRRKS